MKYLIAGLGNIGAEYRNTRHNIGFRVLDEWTANAGVVFEPSRYADLSEIKYKGRTFLLIKPTTLMNRSGKALNYWIQKEKLPLDRVLVITDDIALPFGTLRIRAKGGDGGHNGLKDIIEKLDSKNFPRLRFGVGGDFPKGSQVDHVLGQWSREEEEALPERVGQTVEMVKAFATIGVQRTMSAYNNK